LLVSQAYCFTVVKPSMPSTRLSAGDYEAMEGEGKINLKVSHLPKDSCENLRLCVLFP
jgi:hypothetical protein